MSKKGEKRMNACRVNLTTTVDGRETAISREGEFSLSPSNVYLRYHEENAVVTIKLQGNQAEVDRQGDYSLQLCLQEGVWTKGTLGIGGNSGEIETFAHQIAYSESKHSLLLFLRYDLRISGETQMMKLRIMAREKGDTV